MKKIFGFLEQKLAPMGEKIGKQRHLKALREGIMMAMPLVLLGSFFVLINGLPDRCMDRVVKITLGIRCSFKYNGKQLFRIDGVDYSFRYCLSSGRVL